MLKIIPENIPGRLQAEMRAAGITVTPAKGGGFEAHNVPGTDLVWAATETWAWAHAYAYWKTFGGRNTV